ncbi:MAG: methionine gamma-lyase family protein [Clostridia bacterium]|nr:methionine gamma-lyase family protein [Clostridia bacterium]
MDNIFNIDREILKLSKVAEEKIKDQFIEIERIQEINSQKVLAAFIKNKVGERHLHGTTGYGYNDEGRDVIDAIYADTFGAQDALVRHSFASGTHTLTVALFGILRPGDSVLCITGTPYDTLRGVIKSDTDTGSLNDFNINFDTVDLKADDSFNEDKIFEKLNKKKYSLIYIQRSSGYENRLAFSCEQIGDIVQKIKSLYEINVMVDNCYGEFVQDKEPTQVGADLIVGSLIKNPGGVIAKGGGYIAGRRDLVEKCSFRQTAPKVGKEVGATFDENRNLLLGFYLAPRITAEAMKSAIFTSALFDLMNYEVSPLPTVKRYDIIQRVNLKKPENLEKFCQGLQSGLPIDSYVVPYPWEMPGYDNKVIMAAGGFTAGSSIELSADGPMREPYTAYLQGGIDFSTSKIAIMSAATEVYRNER